jgi:CheY-like chemotaxis protein
MILLTTPSQRAHDCALAINADTGESTTVADSLQQALALLRDAEYRAVILDQAMLEADPDQAEVVLQHTGTAVVLNVNCAVAGTERIVRELRNALRRREKELAAAGDLAEQFLQRDLREPLTAILLECDLALSLPNVSPAVKEKLHSIRQFTRRIQARISCEELEAER